MRFIAIAAALAVAACAHEAEKPHATQPAAAPPATAARTVVQSPQAPKAIGPYSQAIGAGSGRFLFLSGQLPLDPASGEMVPGDIASATDRVMQNLKAVLEGAGASFADVVKTTIFLADLGDFKVVNEVYGRYFTQSPPARATVQVAALPRAARVEIEAVAALPAGAAGRKIVQSAQAPKAIGPYSQAIDVAAGRLVYLSGQLALDPASGNMVAGDVAAQTDRVMQNLKSVLAAAGASFDDVVKTTIYLVDLGDFKVVNETYGKYFTQAPPARATVQMAALPRGGRVEIEAVAAVGAPGTAAGKSAVDSPQAPKALGPYSPGVAAGTGRLLFVSGQLPLDPASGEMAPGDIAAATDRDMLNLKAVLEAGGAGFPQVLKTTIYLADLADFKTVNETYGKYFPQAPPARATVQVKALPRAARVEIECVAAP